ncbi:hypothetical protein MTYP_00658 [Methylophilaceae bacterium]|nr:hypothetical protein MTYP_00658 [Methylophilaceae bacterium]
MTFIKIVGVVAAVAAIGLGNVYANEDGGKAEHKMRADVNQDGKISYDEFRTAHEKRIEQHFKRMDANADGFIDQAEKKAVHEKWAEKRKVKYERCNKPHAEKTY